MSLTATLRRRWQRLVQFFIPERLLVFSFLALILAGTAVLMLPQASTGAPLGFIDALFTATSATCVTGLIVVDTGSAFTMLGQLAILLMIQLGGLGIMTFSTLLLYFLEGRLSLTNRELLQSLFSQGPRQDLASLIKMVLMVTVAFEMIGAVILSLCFWDDMPLQKAVYYGIFHSISAFCNAGFALMPQSLMPYRDHAIINATVMVLIISGGLGFIVIYELLRRPRRRLSLHTRTVLLTSAILIAGGGLLFYLLERGNTLQGLSPVATVLAALFQSVTARTAGFNTVDIAVLSNPALFGLIILMFIGASPASCGGGIKTTTFAILLAQTRARFHGHEKTNILDRQVPANSVSRALTVMFFSTLAVIICTLLLLSTELAGLSHQASRGLFLELLFEVTSAFGTVGLSMGITPNLSDLGRILITAMMFFGRLGPLTIAIAVGRQEEPAYSLAREDVLVG